MARAPVGRKKYKPTELGGKNRIDPKTVTYILDHLFRSSNIVNIANNTFIFAIEIIVRGVYAGATTVKMDQYRIRTSISYLQA